jgi:hypothetical protein
LGESVSIVDHAGLSDVEQRWLAAELREFLQDTPTLHP